jgi:hypothetical protein
MWFFLFYIFFMSVKYIYSLFIYELAIDPKDGDGLYTFNNILTVLGLASTGWNRWVVYYRYDVWNVSWAVVITSFVQY